MFSMLGLRPNSGPPALIFQSQYQAILRTGDTHRNYSLDLKKNEPQQRELVRLVCGAAAGPATSHFVQPPSQPITTPSLHVRKLHRAAVPPRQLT